MTAVHPRPSRLAEAAETIRAAAESLVDAVRQCRRDGMSWADIGAQLGVSRQAVWERFAHLMTEADSPAAHTDERLAAVWDEGYTSGHSNAMRRMSDEPNAPTTPNPYREEER